MTEPNPCPLCGADPKTDRGWPECYYFQIECEACGLSVREDDNIYAEDIATERWNRLRDDTTTKPPAA